MGPLQTGQTLDMTYYFCLYEQTPVTEPHHVAELTQYVAFYGAKGGFPAVMKAHGVLHIVSIRLPAESACWAALNSFEGALDVCGQA
jgi:hypothetical protein